VDIVRPKQKSNKKYVLGALGVVALVATTVALRRLPTAAPSVDRATLWIDTVRKGTMKREVRAPGTLVPEQIRYVSAVTSGRIEATPVRPGVTVDPNTILLEMSNPDVQLQALEAERQLTAAQAQLTTLRTQLETARLNQSSVVAQIRSQFNEAKRQADVQEKLEERKLASANDVAKARDAIKELSERLEFEQQRLKIMTDDVEKQIAMQQSQVERQRAIWKFQTERVASMIVRAGAPGVLQSLGQSGQGTIEVGQWVNAGTQLATVAQPGRLKAVLRVPETQAKDVVVGQKTSIDTRNGIVEGHVMRVFPSAENGTVTVEVALDGALPRGARPDLSVDGTILIEQLNDVMYVGRPAYGQAESTVGLFRLEPDNTHAARVNVRLGRSSVNTIEVVQGLNVGDKVIISDMSAWDNVERVKLK
jgi:multidrug resistance efflux pump